MRLNFSPVRMDAMLQLRRKGDKLVFNDIEVDLATYDPKVNPCDWIAGLPTLGPEGWQVTVLVPHGPDAREETLFPEPITVKGDGDVALPAWGGEGE